MSLPLPPQEVLREAFDYDAETGHLTWRYRAGAPSPTNARDVGRRAGGLRGDGSRTVRVNGVAYAEHRIIWKLLTGQDPPCEIDHRNGDPADNSAANLRLATRSQNGANTKARGPWPKGVCYDRSRKRFAAKMKVGKRTVNLGRFDTPAEAAKAYASAAGRVWGEYTCTNR